MATFDIPVQYFSLPAMAPFEQPVAKHGVFGVRGSLVIIGQPVDQEFSCDVTITDITDYQDLVEIYKRFSREAARGDVKDLVIANVVFRQCVFRGYEEDRPPQWDTAGQRWVSRGKCQFLWLAPEEWAT